MVILTNNNNNITNNNIKTITQLLEEHNFDESPNFTYGNLSIYLVRGNRIEVEDSSNNDTYAVFYKSDEGISYIVNQSDFISINHFVNQTTIIMLGSIIYFIVFGFIFRKIKFKHKFSELSIIKFILLMIPISIMQSSLYIFSILFTVIAFMVCMHNEYENYKFAIRSRLNEK